MLFHSLEILNQPPIGTKKLHLGGKDDYDDDVIFQMIKSR